MSNLDLLIKNAKVMIYDQGKILETKTNVGSKDGLISYIGSDSPNAAQVIEAEGLHLLPGVIDSQVHFREPGMTHKEDLESGSRGAALGGITSYFEMPNTVPPTTTKEAHAEKLSRARGRSWVNYAFFVGGSHENVTELAELEKLPGCPGIKIFMGSSTGSLLVEDDETLEKIFRSGSRRVILHSEDEFRLRDRKHIAIDSKDVHNHHVWRDVESAVSSTKRLLKLSEKTKRPVHILHVSTAEEIEIIKQYKASTGLVTMEVLPQHLTLFAPDCYDRLGTLAQQNPPIREKRHLEALWKAFNDGTIDVMGSDHAPHTLEEKKREYPGSPSGMPSVQTLVPIMLNHIHEQKTSLARFVELVCENPRKIFGALHKGRIAIGLDADFTLVDLKKKKTIQNSWIASRSGWTPYDGKTVHGWPTHTIIKSQIVMQDDQILGQAHGEPVRFG